MDGKDTGKLTPSQFSVDKPGAHTIVVRRYGYLDESSSINVEAGQISNLNLALKPLGSTDEIRAAGGKFKKVFGHGEDSSMGIVSVKTQPKGAQIMVNNRALDKTAPFDFYLKTTRLRSVPMLSTSASITSPDLTNSGGVRAKPTPSGVPVAISVPESRVMPFDTHSRMASTG